MCDAIILPQKMQKIWHESFENKKWEDTDI